MSDSQRWFVLVVLAAGGWLVWLLAPVLTPFVIASFLAYMGDPAADWLEARGAPRGIAVAVVFLVLTLTLLGMLLVLVPMLERQIALLATRLPTYIDWLQNTALPALGRWLDLETSGFDLAALRDFVRERLEGGGGAVAGLLGFVSRSGATLLHWLANLFLVPVVTFYMLRDWDLILQRVRELLPRRAEPEVVRLAGAADEVLGGFLRGQFLVMLALGVIYSVGLMLIGLDLALLVGMLAGLVSFVPYLGLIVGILAAGLAALVEFQQLMPLVWVALVFVAAQVIEGTILTPRLVGERIGLHPVAVIFAVMAGGQLFGFLGVLIALPVAAVAMVLLRYAHERYVNSRLYGAIGGPAAGAPIREREGA